MDFKPKFKTLKEMYDSDGYQRYLDTILGNDLYISNPERANRLNDCAKDGLNGSTYGEIIGDWQSYLNNVNVFDPDLHDAEDIAKYDITTDIRDSIQREIDDRYNYFLAAGTLDEIPGV